MATDPRPMYTRAAFWLGLLGPVLLTMLVAAFDSGGSSLGGGLVALLILFVCAVVLLVVWLSVTAASRAWGPGMIGAGVGLLLALFGYSGVSTMSRNLAQAQWETEVAERESERKRLLPAIDAARRRDDAALQTALAQPSAYDHVESMCALVATWFNPLSSVLEDQPKPERLRDRTGYESMRRGPATAYESEVVMRITAALMQGQDSLSDKQAMLYVLLESLEHRRDGAALFPAWRTLWEQLERDNGRTPQWPPVFAEGVLTSRREACGGGNDMTLQATVQRVQALPPMADTDDGEFAAATATPD